MSSSRIRVLGLCGSPKSNSGHQQLLLAAAQRAPAAYQLEVQSPGPLLPHFDPDAEQRCDHGGGPLPASVRNLRNSVALADAVIVCCPEYAGGIVGSFKNALDWLVGGTEIYQKPFAIWSASPSSRRVRANLQRVLRTMGGVPVGSAHLVLPLRGARLSTTEIAKRYAPELERALQSLATHPGVAQ